MYNPCFLTHLPVAEATRNIVVFCRLSLRQERTISQEIFHPCSSGVYFVLSCVKERTRKACEHRGHVGRRVDAGVRLRQQTSRVGRMLDLDTAQAN